MWNRDTGISKVLLVFPIVISLSFILLLVEYFYSQPYSIEGYQYPYLVEAQINNKHNYSNSIHDNSKLTITNKTSLLMDQNDNNFTMKGYTAIQE